MAAPSKRRKVEKGPAVKQQFTIKFPGTLLYIVDAKIPRVRVDHLKKLARGKGIPVADNLSNDVTHIISELETRDKVLEILNKRYRDVKHVYLENEVEIVSIHWFTASMEENKPIKVTAEHKLPQEQKETIATIEDEAEYQDTKYACQRRTPLKHHNKIFTDALEVLEKNADYTGGDQDYSRALAFRRASASLKSLPHTVTSMRDVANLKDIGKHCKDVIREILEKGYSTEIEDIKSSEWFKTIQLFVGIYGCGPATARKWYNMGYRTLEDIKKSTTIHLTADQRNGIRFYDDLQTPVIRREAEAIRNFIIEEIKEISNDFTVVITGGFIRGKDSGHDVDLLMSHPDNGKEKGVLQKLITNLKQKNLLLECSLQANTFHKESLKSPKHYKSSMLDHFEKSLSIFRLEKSMVDKYTSCGGASKTTEKVQGGKSCSSNTKSDDYILKHTDSFDLPKDRTWRAVRVDFVVCPQSQYGYALLGWVGSKMFNRSIRLYADRELGMMLSSHGLYDRINQQYIPASSEQEIFEHLKLTWIEHEDRNC
ncbi:DNA nucleotidylexotransferase-like [Saccoglossus kowalevskii]|uniref:DNA nucleotidylexotransferase-like n=1 Tax=Saccoglossus kowalevskii TaxID=10224 RepID=A0ABM0GKK3_SACKO|nr:PREDICTED: DNA nucleotidylexotransferase-like [Saccoglossus kowalevskii]